jgi:hypothetical protein
VEHYDVVLVTDARLPGGTTASVAEEVTAQARAGYRTALLHVSSPLVARDRPFAPRLRAAIECGDLDLLLDDAPVRASLLVLRHPTVGASIDPAAAPRIVADERLVIANQAPGTPSQPAADDARRDAGLQYRPAEVTDRLQTWLDGPVRWAPIGPLVREDLERVAPDLPLEARDWVNVIDVDAWRCPRVGARHRIPVIGRHSRDHVLKWPATRTTLLQAYPDRDDVEVHVLGGAGAAARVLGGTIPERWLVVPFGAMPPARFLAGLDLYVYQHHPDWVEAFGRSILEALASGLPTILPHHFAALFADAATYAEPPEVLDAVRALHADRSAYREASERGVGFVEEHFGHAVHVTRLQELLGPPRAAERSRPTALAARQTQPIPGQGSAAGRQRVLFVSSNGAGVGHLMRLLSYARHAGAQVEPLFLTFSQGGKVVDDAGYLVEYLASRSVSGARSVDWHPMLRERMSELIERYDVRAVVFDGTWPYQGLLDAAEDHPHVLLVWSRRGMWRRGVTNPVLEGERDRFDLVVEPGELAADDDRGATRRFRSEARRVGPVVYHAAHELLPPEEARGALGLDPDRPAALVNLGAGNIDDTTSSLGLVVERLGREPDLQVVVTRSVIADAPLSLPENVQVRSIYPLARYLRAFDLAVAAAGYNSFHELTLAAVPTVFVPNLATSTDDQGARAAYAERTGIGVDLRDPDPVSVDQALSQVLEPDRRRRMHERALARRHEGGAAAGMAAIEERLVEGPRDRQPPRARQLAVGAAATGPREGTGATRDTPEEPTSRQVGSLLRRARKQVRRRLAAWAGDPQVRRRFGRLFAALPEEVRRRVRRRLRRWGRRPGGAAAAAPPALPVPAGRYLGAAGGTAGADGAVVDVAVPVLVVVPHLGASEQVDAVVDRVAQLQRARGGFAPLLVVSDLAFAAARRHGYLVEYLPPRQALERLVSADAWQDVRGARLATLIRTYRPARVITLPEPDADGLDRTFAELAAGLEGLDRWT